MACPLPRCLKRLFGAKTPAIVATTHAIDLFLAVEGKGLQRAGGLVGAGHGLSCKRLNKS